MKKMKYTCRESAEPFKLSIKTFFKVFIWILLEFSLVKANKQRRSAEQTSKQSVCYGELGCFSKLPPFSPAMPLPMPPSKLKTEFYLRTRQNLEADQPIIAEAANLTTSFFDPQKLTKILIHGFVMLEARMAKWVPEVTETILYQEDVNVIQVNWIKGASVEYDYATSNTRVVGAQLGHLINMLMEVHNVRAQDFHIIGFSLGAHVAGFAGKKVKESGKHMVGRITGLDPANPGFNYDSPVVRLDKTDAKFVDVVHTDTSTFLVMSSGMNRNIGHIDFYPNGGADQAGCNTWSKESTWISAVTDTTVCDHLRAPQLFKHSINATGDQPYMVGFKCSSYEKFKRGACLRCYGPKGASNRCNRMGYWAKPVNTKKQVQYYLVTSGHAPFTVQHYQIQIHWRNSSFATAGGFKARLFITLHGDNGSTPEIMLNDGATFHVYAGQTTRFLVTQDTQNDIGEVQRVTFRWERPTCWTYIFCPSEDIVIKRIKVLDAGEQKKSVFLPLGKNRNERIREHVIKPGEKFELLRTSYIRRQYPERRYKALRKAEAKLKNYSRNIIVPPIVSLTHEKLPQTNSETVTKENDLLTTGPSLTTGSQDQV